MGKAGNRPSFILFVTDQQRADFLGCYGHPLLQTPNIDALAARGAVFDRFYVASPVCMPNRASLMTGRLPSAHGVRANGIPLAAHNVTFVELLRDAGYRTALIGKSHLQNFSGKPPLVARPRAHPGFHRPGGALAEARRHDLGEALYRQEEPDFWSSPQPRLETPFYGFDHVELVTGHGDGVGGDYVAWALAREPGLGSLIGPENQLAHDYVCPQAVRTGVPPQLYSTSYIAERARAFLAGQDGDTPFFLMVSFPDPHHPFNPPGRYWDMYTPDDFATPEAFSRDDWAPPPHVAAVLAEREAGAARLGGMGTIACSPREAREAQALTCGMISMIDEAVGGVIEALETSGRGSDTVAVFTSDHGDHLGDHCLLLKGAEHYEQITRVPFIWADPQGPRGVRRQAIGQTHDIAATLLERARIEPFIGMQGISLVPAMAGGAGRPAAFIQYDHQKDNPGIGPQPRVHTLRDARYRLSLIHGVTWGELYDLEADPGEFDNLWEVPAAAAIKARLIEHLAREEVAAADRAPFPLALA
ncbi:MAG: sulfatase-like hydrolase/transferase [Rhodobiaceae bacterium]|nr:sulfatase-like hydrolase/transferase [Rhodobiaceae bacterium]